MSNRNLDKMLPIRLHRSTYDFIDRVSKKMDRPKAWVIRRLIESFHGSDESDLADRLSISASKKEDVT